MEEKLFALEKLFILLDSVIIGSVLAFLIISIYRLAINRRTSVKKKYVVGLSVVLISGITMLHYLVPANFKVSFFGIRLDNGYEISNSDIGIYFRKEGERNIKEWVPISKFNKHSFYLIGYFEPGFYDKSYPK